MVVLIPILAIEMFLSGAFMQPSIDTDASGIAIMWLLLNSLIMIVILSRAINDYDGSSLNNILVMAFVLRILVLLWDVYARGIFVLPNSEADAVGYHQVAISYAFGKRAGLVDLTDYSYYIGLLYRIAGIQKITAQFINVYFSMFSIVLISKITYLLDIRYEIRRKMILLLCFLPNVLIVSSILLQETIIAFCLVLAVYYYVRWWVGESSINVIIAILASVAGSLLHSGGLVAAAGILFSMPFVGNRNRILKISGFKILLSGMSIMLFLVVVSRYGSSLLDKVGGSLSADSIVSSAGQTDRISNADYLLGDTGMSSTASLLLLTPIRMLYFICSPLPWMWRGISDIIAFFGSALFYIFSIKEALNGYKYGDSDDALKSFLFFIILTLLIASFMFGWGVSNTGTALRHREKFTYLFGLMFAIGRELYYRSYDNE